MENKLAIKLRKFNRICPITGYKEESIKVGSSVIVLTDRGEEFGTIISFAKNAPKANGDVRLKKVIRYATEEDMKTVKELDRKEDEAFKIASEKAKEYELPMKIVGIEYLFDTKKLNLYYKIDKTGKNPDLKSYKKDISQILKAEITTRLVTPRDEAKFIGGLGPCGKDLCCISWLQKPKHITVKMVKDQGVQISPTKTSGVCGRLMCCFDYEYECGQKCKGEKQKNG